MAKKSANPVVDWEAVEREYRAGIRSLRDIGAEFGVSNPAIIKRAKRDGWVRDLSAKIKAAAEALVSKDAVSSSVSTVSKSGEKQIIEAGAELQASIIRSHRKDVTRSRALAMSLLSELEQTTENNDLFERLGKMLRAPDDNGADKLNDIYRKVIAMPQRIDSAKKLAETLKILIACEREAFGLDKMPDTDHEPVTSITRRIV